MFFPSLFRISVPSLSKVTVTVTGWFVVSFMSYSKVAFGNVLIIQSTDAVTVPEFP